MSVPRIVLDTNCLVSALIFKRSRLSILRTAWMTGKFIPVACHETVNELIRVLAYPKFKLDKGEIEQLLADILPFTENCIVPNPYAAVHGLSDPSDAVFLHLARLTKADMLVSGDAHLLALQNSVPNVVICSSVDFLKIFADMQQ